MRTVMLEEHFATPAFLEGPVRQVKDFAQVAQTIPIAQSANLLEQLCDLDQLRIADVDAAGIDVQVLSLTSRGISTS